MKKFRKEIKFRAVRIPVDIRNARLHNTLHQLIGKYFRLFGYFCKSRECVVSVMVRLRAGRSGLKIPTWAKQMPLLQNGHIESGVQPPSNSISNDTPSKGIKKPDLKADRSPPSTARSRTNEDNTSSPAVCLHGLSKKILLPLPHTLYTMAVFSHMYLNIRNMGNVL